MAEKRCLGCQARFYGRSNRQLRCDRCREAAEATSSRVPVHREALLPRSCERCARAYQPVSRNQRWCGAFCRSEARRPVMAERYGPDHRRKRRQVEAVVNAGSALCVRCGFAIVPGTPWDLDHADDGDGYLGASHASCNRAAPNYRQEVNRTSRQW